MPGLAETGATMKRSGFGLMLRNEVSACKKGKEM